MLQQRYYKLSLGIFNIVYLYYNWFSSYQV